MTVAGGDARIRALEREARGAAPGSPERQRWLVELHRRGVDPLPLVAGDLVRIVAYYPDRRPSSFDGALATFARWDVAANTEDVVGRSQPWSNLRPCEAVVDVVDVVGRRGSWASWIAPVDPGEGGGDAESGQPAPVPIC